MVWDLFSNSCGVFKFRICLHLIFYIYFFILKASCFSYYFPVLATFFQQQHEKFNTSWSEHQLNIEHELKPRKGMCVKNWKNNVSKSSKPSKSSKIHKNPHKNPRTSRFHFLGSTVIFVYFYLLPWYIFHWNICAGITRICPLLPWTRWKFWSIVGSSGLSNPNGFCPPFFWRPK